MLGEEDFDVYGDNGISAAGTGRNLRIALTEVSTSVAVMIVVFVAVIILFGAKKIGIFSMKNNAGTH